MGFLYPICTSAPHYQDISYPVLGSKVDNKING